MSAITATSIHRHLALLGAARLANLPIGVIVTCLALLLGTNRAFADSQTLTLVGAGPTGVVELTSQEPNLLGGYNNDSFYAGVLDWADNAPGTGGAADVFTYCIDIQAVIDINNSYAFTNDGTAGSSISDPSLTSGAVSSTGNDVLQALENLFVDHESDFESTLVYGTGSSETAAELQIAIWDIIYNTNTNVTTASANPQPNPKNNVAVNQASNSLYFSNPWSPLTTSDINTAFAWANKAFNLDSAETPGSNSLNFYEAAPVGSGQNQLYMSLSSAPLPSTAGTSLSLLAALGVVGYAFRKRLPLLTSRH